MKETVFLCTISHCSNAQYKYQIPFSVFSITMNCNLENGERESMQSDEARRSVLHMHDAHSFT